MSRIGSETVRFMQASIKFIDKSLSRFPVREAFLIEKTVTIKEDRNYVRQIIYF